MSAAFARVLNALETRGCRPRGNDRQRQARCPAHDDHRPSLNVTKRDGTVLVHCHAGCGQDAVLAALGLLGADLYDEPAGQAEPDPDWTPRGPAVASYLYQEADRQVRFGVCRTADKQFPCWRPDPRSKTGRRWRLDGVDKRIPYRLPELLAGIAEGRVVWATEGEKDVEALRAHGLIATCNAGGAGEWTAEHARHLAGADVIVVADRDAAGRRHAEQVMATLLSVAHSVEIVQARDGKDAADHLAAGHKPHQFVAVATPKPWVPSPVVTAALGAVAA